MSDRQLPAKHAQSKTLQDRVAAQGGGDPVSVSSLVEEGAITALKKVIEALPGGAVISAIMDTAENVRARAEQEKTNAILSEYLNKTDDLEAAAAKLTDFVTDPTGAMLFSRLRQVADRVPPDPRLLDGLRAALKTMTHSDFRKSFEDHDFALGLLEELTAQGMMILMQYDLAQQFVMPGGAAFINGELIGDWSELIAVELAPAMGLASEILIRRFAQVHGDLIRKGFIRGVNADVEGRMVIKPELTGIGQIVRDYLID